MNLKVIRTKIYIVCILSILLILGLLYLMLSGGTKNLQQIFNNKKEAEVEVVEPEEPEEPCSIDSDCGPQNKAEQETVDNTSKENEVDKETETKKDNTEDTSKEADTEKETASDSQTNDSSNTQTDNTTESATNEESSAESEKENTDETSTESNVLPEEERKKVDVTTDSSFTKIVNPQHLLDRNYEASDMEIPEIQQYGQQLLRREAALALEEMFAAAKNDGINLFLISGYRAYGEQEYLYQYYLNQSSVEALAMSDSIPGGTEHQLGLSVDLGGTDHVCELQNCFEDTATYKWLKDNSYKYGYIERHPKGKEEYTHIAYNPWSFRYIGKEEAKHIFDSKMAVEEYYMIDAR